MRNASRRRPGPHISFSTVAGLLLCGALAPGAQAVNVNEAVGFSPNHTLSGDGTGEYRVSAA